MKALTLYQPWAFAVARLGKRIENRPWRPWPSIVGQVIAIHAAAKRDQLMENDAALRIGAIVGYNAFKAMLAADLPRGAIVATARVTGHVAASADPWFVGPFGWTLDDVVALPTPVPCRGAQGLWTVPLDVEALVLGGGR